MSSSLLLQPCLTRLVRLIWMVLEIGCRWSYSCCFVRCCFQNLFNIARRILVWSSSYFFSIALVSVHVVHLYSRIDTSTAWKKFSFILSDRSDFHTIGSLSITIHVFAMRIMVSLSVDEILLPRHMNSFTNFKEPPFRVELSPSWLKHLYSVLSDFTWRPICSAAFCNRDLARVGVFARGTMSSL